MRKHYILKGREVVTLEGDNAVLEWAEWFEKADRHVSTTELDAGSVKIVVSTVFLGLDHNFGYKDEKRPVLFETMIYSPRAVEIGGNKWDDCQWRYCTYDEAETCHNVIVSLLWSGIDPSDYSVEELLENWNP